MSTVAPASRELKIPTSARPYSVTAVPLAPTVTLAVSLDPLDIPAGTVRTIAATIHPGRIKAAG
ncbi:hypothetical protein [Rhizohabitans arisaemae]|uniref:hypothetical protein n=1 Tax=Rhizohabitans arisaemae TaxID=2720610 RepID=UPI0024B0829C|nr:hypothetical protein [Rhizohabitans arisaemae]